MMSALPPKADILHCTNRDLLGEVLTNFCQQLAWAERLWHVVITTRRSRLLLFITERIRGDGDNRDRSQRRIAFDSARSGVTIHDRHLNIHQDEIGPLLCNGRERLLAVFRLGDLIVGRGKHVANDLATIRLVLDHQNALAPAVGSTCRSTMTGSVKVNVEPWPGCDSTQIRPPCISMIRLEMASLSLLFNFQLLARLSRRIFFATKTL